MSKQELDQAEKFMNYLNMRMNRPQVYFDPISKKHNSGCFYMKKGMSKKGDVYDICEVLDENGAYKSYGPAGMTVKELMVFLNGFNVGYNIAKSQ